MGREVAPTLEGPPRAGFHADYFRIEHEVALADALLVDIGAHVDQALTAQNLTADHPKKRAAIGEFIEHGSNGLLVAPAAPDELASALARLVRDPELRLDLARHAAETVRTRFSYEAGVDWIASALGQARVPEARSSEVRAAE